MKREDAAKVEKGNVMLLLCEEDLLVTDAIDGCHSGCELLDSLPTKGAWWNLSNEAEKN